MNKSIIVLFCILLALNCGACKHIEQVEKSADKNTSDMIATEEISETIDKIEMPERVETIEPEIEADTTAEENSTETEKESEVTLIMVGDMLMHTPVNETGVMEDGGIDFSHLFTYTKDMIKGADLAIVNQEVILGGKELGISGYPAFNTYQEFGGDLVDAGFDVVLHATNHALDKGKKGILSCLSYWESAYPEIAVLGIQDTAEEQAEQKSLYKEYLAAIRGSMKAQLDNVRFVEDLSEEELKEELANRTKKV